MNSACRFSLADVIASPWMTKTSSISEEGIKSEFELRKNIILEKNKVQKHFGVGCDQIIHHSS